MYENTYVYIQYTHYIHAWYIYIYIHILIHIDIDVYVYVYAYVCVYMYSMYIEITQLNIIDILANSGNVQIKNEWFCLRFPLVTVVYSVVNVRSA